VYELREEIERLRNTLETIADIAERNSTMESLRGIGKLARESLIHNTE
jgi:Ni,Fe-hydrogenase III large subunit